MSRLSILLVIWAVLAAFAAAQTAFKPQTAPGVACFSYSSKYRYCFAVASGPDSKTACAAKTPDGRPDTFATQTQCCKEKFGTCGYSGGPSGRSCWMPDTTTKKCKLLSLEELQAGKCSNAVGGFQSEAVCQAESFPSARGAAGGATTLPAVLPPAGRAAPATAPGVACFSFSSKYNYCFAVMATDPTAKTTCGTKTPGSLPGTYATQTQCCKEKFGGKCGFSGGPSGRTCWMPDTATKKCKLVSLEATKGEGCNNAVGGFQSEAVCVAESF